MPRELVIEYDSARSWECYNVMQGSAGKPSLVALHFSFFFGSSDHLKRGWKIKACMSHKISEHLSLVAS